MSQIRCNKEKRMENVSIEILSLTAFVAFEFALVVFHIKYTQKSIYKFEFSKSSKGD